jgi:hypothetical protein
MSESDVVIRVEGLGKKYSRHHEQSERYKALRDVVAHQALFKPPSSSDECLRLSMEFSQHALEKCALYGVNPELLRDAPCKRRDLSRSEPGRQPGSGVRISGSPLGCCAHPG